MAEENLLQILREGSDAWNEWRSECANACLDLSGIDLVSADLRKANLRAANLANAHLKRINLRGADLGGADLRGADLRAANLRNANLAKAYLRGANLRKANLRRASLSEADLGGADLGGANLSGVDFAGAILFGGTVFYNVDLSGAVNLGSCDHRGPSCIDPSTLTRSSDVPKEFWRGCGLSEVLIDHIPSLFGSGMEFFSAFLSHNSEDKRFVRELHDQLQGRGVRCWLDEKQILPGDDIHTEIDRGIRVWDKLILICSKNSLNPESGWWVSREMKKAMAKEKKIWTRKGEEVSILIPVDIDGYIFSESCNNPLKDGILERGVADFTNWQTPECFENSLGRLVQALRADQGRKEPPPASKL